MPYGQILEIMVALILTGAAPERPMIHSGPVVILEIWLLKAACWYLLCFYFLKKQEKNRPFHRLQFWEWMALLPFVLDLYFLNINLFFQKLSSFLGLSCIREILGMFLFFFYLVAVWYAEVRTKGEKNILVQNVYSRLRLLLPVLVPYFLLILAADILSKLPIPFIKSWFSSKYSSAILFLLFILFFLFLLPSLIIRLWNCSPLPASDLRKRIDHVLEKQGIKFSDIMLWSTGESMACTAAVMGILPGFRYILLTPCLIRFLQPEEIEAVIAHEVEHVRRKHILWYVILLVCYSAVLYRLSDPLVTWLLSNSSLTRLFLVADEVPGPVLSLLGAIPLAILIVLYFRFLIGYFMRNFERQADMAAFKVHGHPFFLINALKKVAFLSGIDPTKPNWHHYSISERIVFLEKAYQNPQLLSKHNHRLNTIRFAFMAVICFLLLLPSALPTKTWKSRAHSNLLLLYYEELLQRDEKNPKFYLVLGEIAFEKKKYREAELAYRKVLKIQPDNPEALNNLAWLYIKSDDPDFKRPKEALLLAMQAARTKPEPFILDTLAECFFQNGYTRRALQTEMEALSKAKTNRNYYKKQVERFKNAIGKDS